MKILDEHLPAKDFVAFANHNLDMDLVCTGFSEARMKFYKNRVALWQKLRPAFDRAKLNSKSIKENGVLVESNEITSLILGEALEYFGRAFCNFYAHDELIQHGYFTWSEITNYYSSFFGVHSLLRLQGRCITLLWRPKGKQVYVFPYDFQQHKYVICLKGVEGKSAHEAAWSLYYEVYDGFTYSENTDFEYIFKKKHVGTYEEEMDFRNKINYEPYQGYDEIRNPHRIPAIVKFYVEKRFTTNEIELLSRLTTDPDFRFYARSALRLIFCYSMLMDIAKKNDELQSLLYSRKKSLSDFLKRVKPLEGDHTLCHRLQTILGLEVPSVAGTGSS